MEPYIKASTCRRVNISLSILITINKTTNDALMHHYVSILLNVESCKNNNIFLNFCNELTSLCSTWKDKRKRHNKCKIIVLSFLVHLREELIKVAT